MDKFEMRKLSAAKNMLEQLAEGMHPLSGRRLEEEHLVNHPVMVRFFCFLREVIEAVLENQGAVGRKLPMAPLLPFPVEALRCFEYREDQTLTFFLRQICEPVNDPMIGKIMPASILRWLSAQGFMTEGTCPYSGKKVNLPTERGIKLGLYTRRRLSQGGEYTAVFYGKRAQEFIVANMEGILGWERQEREKLMEKARNLEEGETEEPKESVLVLETE